MFAGRQKQRPGWMRFAGAGFELAAAVIGFSAVGYWVGGYFGSAVWGVVVGAALGVVGGMYNLIRATLAMSRQSARRGPGSGGGE